MATTSSINANPRGRLTLHFARRFSESKVEISANTGYDIIVISDFHLGKVVTGVFARSPLITHIARDTLESVINGEIRLIKQKGTLDLTPLWRLFSSYEQSDVLPGILRLEAIHGKLGFSSCIVPSEAEGIEALEKFRYLDRCEMNDEMLMRILNPEAYQAEQAARREVPKKPKVVIPRKRIIRSSAILLALLGTLLVAAYVVLPKSPPLPPHFGEASQFASISKIHQLENLEYDKKAKRLEASLIGSDWFSRTEEERRTALLSVLSLAENYHPRITAVTFIGASRKETLTKTEKGLALTVTDIARKAKSAKE